MAGIPVGEAAFEGFTLIRRKPLAVLVWGLVLFAFFVAVFAMLGAVFGSAWNMVSELDGAEPDVAEAFAFQMQIMMVQFGMWLISILMRVVLTCAVFRAVLEPQNDRFAYLRLGKVELLVALVLLCLSIILAILLMGGLLVGIGVTLAAWAASKALAVGLGILVFGALIVLFAWVGLRLSMSLPMTFADRRFRFFEAWELTRGHVGSLFLVLLVVIAIVLLIEIAIVGVALAIAMSVAAGGGITEASLEAFFQRPPQEWLAVLGPAVLIGGVLFGILGAALMAITTAPWAAAYRALATPATDAAQSPA